MLKKELVEKLMEMAGDKYTKTQLNRMLKADLEKLYEEYSKESVSANKSDVENKSGDVQNSTTTANSKSDNNIKAFDITKYSNFKCHKNARNRKPSTNQLKLIKALELNYKVRFDNVESATFGELSDRISACFEAIKQGKVKKRSAEEKIAKLKNYKSKAKAEVAVTTANDTTNNSDVLNNLENKLKDKTFRVKFIEYLKRVFS